VSIKGRDLYCVGNLILRRLEEVSQSQDPSDEKKRKRQNEGEGKRQQGLLTTYSISVSYSGGRLEMSAYWEQVCALRQSPLACWEALHDCAVRFGGSDHWLATGLRWASVERAFGQLRSDWRPGLWWRAGVMKRRQCTAGIQLDGACELGE
jgi:hypothetical protein